MKNKGKFLWMLALLCVCFSLLGVASVAQASDSVSNLLTDGGFSASDLNAWPNGWDGTGTSRGIDASQDYEGNSASGSVKLYNETRGNQTVAQTVSLTQGKLYRLSGWIKTESITENTRAGGCGAFITAGISSDANECVIGYIDYNTEIGTNAWMRFSRDFTASKTGNYVIRIRLWGSAGTMWADEISLIEATSPDIGLADGRFVSQGTTSLYWNKGWKGNGDKASHTWNAESRANDGTGSLVVDHSAGVTSSYAATNVYLVENSKYKVSGWIKTRGIKITSANDNVGAYIAFDEKYKFYFGAVGLAGDNDWKYYESYFTATATGTHKLECKIWGATGVAYFDDINVEMVATTDPEVLKHWTDNVTFPTDDGGFTLIGVGDTQGIAASDYANRFTELYTWMAEMKEAYNIQYVMDLGDIVDVCDDAKQWKVATEAHKILRDANVKYSISPGNHDYDGLVGLPGGTMVERNSTTYNSYFPKAEYDAWLGNENFGTYDQTMDNAWHTFEQNGYSYMIIALEYGPRDEVLAWAKELADSHPNHHVIVTTHAYLDGSAQRHDDAEAHLEDSNGGNAMWDKFVKKCPNIFMVLGGHYVGYGLSTLVSYGEAGNPIVQMKVDAQNILGGGESLVALYRITNGTDVSVYYYSANQKKYYAGSNFSLNLSKIKNGVISTYEGYTGDLLFSVLDGTKAKYTVTSSNANVAKVLPDGKVQARGIGEAVLSVRVEGAQTIYATSGVLTVYEIRLRVESVSVASIQAVFNDGMALKADVSKLTAEDLKDYLRVTALYEDGVEGGIREYTVTVKDGALKEGENVLVVTAEGFSCEVVAHLEKENSTSG
ncbi:MAG: metallophosphoesterase, partial [Clostridia bacterium]|nr:metallophosphoesterase [Clostridia bacterium]